jgi:Holliday junction resolvase RusA-like endonuclease
LINDDGTILIVVAGEPVAQGRPRISTAGGFPRAYDPAKSRNWKQYARLVAQEVMQNEETLLYGPVSLSVRVYRSIPKSFSKKKRQGALEGGYLPTTRPDLDNYVKGATDAINGIVIKDDSQIVKFHEPFGKWYSDKPRVEIEIKEI